MENKNTNDAIHAAPPPYPYPNPGGAPAYNSAAPLPDGYYAAGAPPPYPAGPGQQYPPPPPGYPQGQMYYPSGQTQAIVIQPQPNVVVVGQYGLPPPDHQALAWFACLCCFWPVGIAAIMKSKQVREASARGDYGSARMASNSARTLSMVSIGLGIASYILAIAILFIIIIQII